jgi:hypothetical protein
MKAIRSSGLNYACVSGRSLDAGTFWHSHNPLLLNPEGRKAGNDLVYRLFKEEGLGPRRRHLVTTPTS